MKNKLIVRALILVATMCVSLISGCWVDSARIEFVEEPAKTYYVNEAIGDFVIRDMDTKKEYHYVGNENLITIENFSTATPGSRTAKVTFGDYTIEFAYTVIGNETGFAGGDGSMANPYQVATTDHFNLMLKTGHNAATASYYKLVADIDFAGKTIIQTSSTYRGTKDSQYFTGIVDGNNYRVENICDITAEGLTTNEKFNEIFGAVGNFELKNATFHFASEGENACTGLVSNVSKTTPNAEVVIENVDTEGYIDLSARNNTSIGVYVAQAHRGGRGIFTIKDCKNTVSIYNGATCNYVAGYATINTKNHVFNFVGNNYEGTIEGGFGYGAALIGLTGDKLSDDSVISGNTVGANTKVVKVNQNDNLSGIYAGSVSFVTANIDAEANDDYNTELEKATATVANNVITLDMAGIETDEIRIMYSAQYSDGGGLFFSNTFAVAADMTAQLIVPSELISVTEAMADEYSVDQDGIWFKDGKAYFLKARTVKNIDPQVFMVGYNNGVAVWSTGKISGDLT